ncbi:MAG: hypothetical protein PHD95_05385 [Candidatus ainarchaeum sp.]|nr:hypothetical protein [Candidatus ainarchaeum sp.]
MISRLYSKILKIKSWLIQKAKDLFFMLKKIISYAASYLYKKYVALGVSISCFVVALFMAFCLALFNGYLPGAIVVGVLFIAIYFLFPVKGNISILDMALYVFIIWNLAYGAILAVLGSPIVFVFSIALACFGLTAIAVYNIAIGKEKEKQAAILGGAGILLFTIISFGYSLPMFFDEGTADCTNREFKIISNAEKTIADNNDLTQRNFGANTGIIIIKTKVFPETYVRCEYGCEVAAPKFSYFEIPYENPNRDSLSKQYTNIRLSIANDQNYFEFQQQRITKDLIADFLTQNISPLNYCECTRNKENTAFICQNKSFGFKDILIYTGLFEASKAS